VANNEIRAVQFGRCLDCVRIVGGASHLREIAGDTLGFGKETTDSVVHSFILTQLFRTATYTPAEPNSQISGAPSGAETTETSTTVTASPTPDPEPHWWGSAPNITEAAQEERAFILDAVQSGIGGVSITGTNLHATLLTWDGTTINYPEPSRPEPIDTVTRITLNTDCTVLSIPPRALAQLRSLVVGGENLILANTSLGFTRTLGRGALVLSESGYATLAIAIIG